MMNKLTMDNSISKAADRSCFGLPNASTCCVPLPRDVEIESFQPMTHHTCFIGRLSFRFPAKKQFSELVGGEFPNDLILKRIRTLNPIPNCFQNRNSQQVQAACWRRILGCCLAAC